MCLKCSTHPRAPQLSPQQPGWALSQGWRRCRKGSVALSREREGWQCSHLPYPRQQTAPSHGAAWAGAFPHAVSAVVSRWNHTAGVTGLGRAAHQLLCAPSDPGDTAAARRAALGPFAMEVSAALLGSQLAHFHPELLTPYLGHNPEADLLTGHRRNHRITES